ncbi:MAG: IS6 family transposase [Nitrososphaeraceae archaeon]
MSNQLVEIRIKRGQEILQKGATITKIDEYTYNINSLTSNSIYEINNLENRLVCSCPDFQYREVELCKHIACLQIWLTSKVEEKPKVFADDAIQCDECGSIRIVKYGFDCGKQTYYCKDCHKKFREPSILRKVKFTPELITLCLDLYFSGLSLRKISRNISDHFNVDINYSTIYDWIQRYIPQISNYVNSLTPQLSESWHIDELFVKMKGGDKRKGNANVAYLWNILDRDSRYLLTSKLSEKRDTNGAIQAINEAIHNSHGNLPQIVYTDALRAYREGVSKTLGNQVDHIARCGITKPHANNNRVERLNGTLRARVKVQRGWKTHKSAIAEGQRIYYNFVKPHQALGGKTPAEKVGINTRENNKILKLMKELLL